MIITFTFILVGCASQTAQGPKISFDAEKSTANYVRLGDEALLTIEYVVKNETSDVVGPVTMKLNIENPKIREILKEDDPLYPILFGMKVTLVANEVHGYGATFKLDKSTNELTSYDELKDLIENNRSLEIQLFDESGKIINSQWIQKLNEVEGQP